MSSRMKKENYYTNKRRTQIKKRPNNGIKIAFVRSSTFWYSFIRIAILFKLTVCAFQRCCFLSPALFVVVCFWLVEKKSHKKHIVKMMWMSIRNKKNCAILHTGNKPKKHTSLVYCNWAGKALFPSFHLCTSNGAVFLFVISLIALSFNLIHCFWAFKCSNAYKDKPINWSNEDTNFHTHSPTIYWQ